MFMEFPGVFALKENLTCSVYMSTAGVKGRGGRYSPVTLNHMKVLQGKRGRKQQWQHE